MNIWSRRIALNMNEKNRIILPWSIGQNFSIFFVHILRFCFSLHLKVSELPMSLLKVRKFQKVVALPWIWTKKIEKFCPILQGRIILIFLFIFRAVRRLHIYNIYSEISWPLMVDSLKNYILGLENEIQYCTYAYQADVYNGRPI